MTLPTRTSPAAITKDAITKDAIRAAEKKLAEVEEALAETATSSPLSAVVGADDVRAAWERLDIDRQRDVMPTLVRVT